jgi:hypothetical protein
MLAARVPTRHLRVDLELASPPPRRPRYSAVWAQGGDQGAVQAHQVGLFGAEHQPIAKGRRVRSQTRQPCLPRWPRGWHMLVVTASDDPLGRYKTDT